MAHPHPPQAVKLVMGMISARQELFEQACHRLASCWGEVDMISPVFPFDQTNSYQPEMGDGLLRRFVSFENLIDAQNLAACKLLSNEVEEFFAEEGKRRINLDPGYLNEHQLVLASSKNFAHRIYLAKGIYADLTLQYRRGCGWQDLPWSYPDYRLAASKEFFSQVRREYRRQLHKVSS